MDQSNYNLKKKKKKNFEMDQSIIILNFYYKKGDFPVSFSHNGSICYLIGAFPSFHNSQEYFLLKTCF